MTDSYKDRGSANKRDRVHMFINDHPWIFVPAYTATIAGFTYVIMRGVALQPIDRGISVIAKRGISVLGKKVVMNNVSYISSNRQGAPSWVVRCIETGSIFPSQRLAALTMDIPEREISKHLNGIMDNVRGFTFERICMAA